MSLGAYIHIPYCLQRCTYCDFATYEHKKILPPADYVALLRKEIRLRSSFFEPTALQTIYFGGGTPSLLEAPLIVSVIEELESCGFPLGPKAEVTIEINPATINEEKLAIYLDGGINRFSVGAQTFDDSLLKSVNREHSAKQTLETLELLAKKGLNYSFDLLFALPGQKLSGLKKDLEIISSLSASHISPYCLTVPSGHPLSKGRPPEEEQVEMFNLIDQSLVSSEFVQYEISNYAKLGFESQHNLLYWTDQPWMSFGLSAHGYAKQQGPWGTRFWNLNNIQDYTTQIDSLTSNGKVIRNSLPEAQFEELTKAQSLTDFCHTHLRLMRGLDLSDIENKYGPLCRQKVSERLQSSLDNGLLVKRENNRLSLSSQGIVLSNLVLERILFSDSEIN
ncbi:MAG: radical SAM family heme chaperone HemW [Bdellovibrionia bacterium]